MENSLMQPNISSDFRSHLGQAAVSAAKVRFLNLLSYVELSNICAHDLIFEACLQIALLGYEHVCIYVCMYVCMCVGRYR